MSGGKCKKCNSMHPNASCGECCPEWLMRETYDGLLADHRRLEWILSHVTHLEPSEMVAGNFEKYTIDTTRESVDAEIRRGDYKPTTSLMGVCTCVNGMLGALECPIHGCRFSSANV
jgi:hypothetical protein